MRIIKKDPPNSNQIKTNIDAVNITNEPQPSLQAEQGKTSNSTVQPRVDVKHLRRHVGTTSNKRLKDNTGTSVSRSSADGYNSDDEVTTPTKSLLGLIRNAQAKLLNEQRFEEDLQARGLAINRVAGDGNCLFRSVADQVYGDENMQDEVRRLCMQYMEQERDYFSQFVTEDFSDYIARKRQHGTFGNHLELQAISEMFNRPIEIFAYNEEPLNLFQTEYDTDNAPIKLSYHNSNHYNSVRDLNNPSVGVGLGLPGYDPSEPDRQQVRQAVAESEAGALEDEIIQHSIRQSEEDDITNAMVQAQERQLELESAEAEIERAVIEQSMRDYYNSLQK